MTTLLREAFEMASLLPRTDQNKLARSLLAEIESEKRWNHAFGRSQDALHRMGKMALADFKAGRGKHMGIEEL